MKLVKEFGAVMAIVSATTRKAFTIGADCIRSLDSECAPRVLPLT